MLSNIFTVNFNPLLLQKVPSQSLYSLHPSVCDAGAPLYTKANVTLFCDNWVGKGDKYIKIDHT